MNSSFPSFEDVQKARVKFNDIAYKHWVHDDLFTWKWYLLLVLSILPWIVWWIVVDKKRLNEIVLYGSLITIGTYTLDNIGTDLIWWEYPTKLFQMIPPLLPADLSLIPCSMMLIYQWSKNWRSFLLFNFLLSLFCTYIGEPLFIWLDYYELKDWKLIYSLLFYNIGGMLARWLVLKIFSVSEK
ncbi:hypothetical protein EV146_11664 [Mesobacillus foraminis]|uniref:Uncharacterized protein n=1 Tax=Mesobacillus foraminis TaxID=279826 RepID=A0A4R2B3K3_9BACI|nr:hypothetical protein EV146_11664 [Mesobacillus foraminis]